MRLHLNSSRWPSWISDGINVHSYHIPRFIISSLFRVSLASIFANEWRIVKHFRLTEVNTNLKDGNNRYICIEIYFEYISDLQKTIITTRQGFTDLEEKYSFWENKINYLFPKWANAESQVEVAVRISCQIGSVIIFTLVDEVRFMFCIGKSVLNWRNECGKTAFFFN